MTGHIRFGTYGVFRVLFASRGSMRLNRGSQIQRGAGWSSRTMSHNAWYHYVYGMVVWVINAVEISIYLWLELRYHPSHSHLPNSRGTGSIFACHRVEFGISRNKPVAGRADLRRLSPACRGLPSVAYASSFSHFSSKSFNITCTCLLELLLAGSTTSI